MNEGLPTDITVVPGLALSRRQAVLLEEVIRKSAVTGNDSAAWGALYANVVRVCRQYGVEVQGPLE